MPAPYPHEAVAGRVGIRVMAQQVYGNYVWLARWSDEMTGDAEVNFKKLGQFSKHCHDFRSYIDALRAARAGGARGAIETVFRENDIEWATRAAMVADITAVYDGAGAILAWIEAAHPEVRGGYASSGLDANYQPVEVIPTMVKSAEFATRITEFRGLFGPKG